jgi:hypothetical protein
MPKVGGKHYSYTPKGRKEAKVAARRLGKGVVGVRKPKKRK